MTMNTRVHIAKPVNPELFFLHILAILESDPNFTPSWEKPSEDPFGAAIPGPLKLGKATYKHVRKGDVMKRSDGTVMINHSTGEPLIEDENELRTTIGQGLAAIWEVTYAEDGPLVWPPHYDDIDEEEDREIEEEARRQFPNSADPLREHLVSANFDTAYGYKVGDAQCSDLHAFLLREIGLYLASVGVMEWSWQHEEKGSWHRPYEIDLRGRAELASWHFRGQP